LIISRSSLNWDNSKEFRSDLKLVLTSFASKSTSPEFVLDSILSSFWLLLNVTTADTSSSSSDIISKEMFSYFKRFFKDFKPRSMTEDDVQSCKLVTADFLKDLEETKEAPYQSSLPQELVEADLEEQTEYYIEKSKKFASLCTNVLKKVDIRVENCTEKQVEDAVRESQMFFNGDCSRIPDYLCGTVTLHVDKYSDHRLLKSKFDMMKKNFSHIVSQRISPPSEDRVIPSILLHAVLQQDDDWMLAQILVLLQMADYDLDVQQFDQNIRQLSKQNPALMNDRENLIWLCVELLRSAGVDLSNELTEGWIGSETECFNLEKAPDSPSVSLTLRLKDGQQRVMEFVLEEMTNRFGNPIGKYKIRQV
jgi:hypothetical protein